jgi:peroxiredoxin Q/BCP
MSKKTRKKTLKKSPTAPTGKAAKARSTAAAKKPAAKKRSTPPSKPAWAAGSKSKAVAKAATKTAAKTAKKTAKTVTKPVAKADAKIAAPKASHQGASKPLTLPAAAPPGRPAAPESKAATAKPKTGAAKPNEAGHPPAPTTGHAALAEGAKAPAFHLPRDGGDTVSLADFAGRKLVLFFYPRADTPGCTKEAIDFTRLAGAFADSRTAVLGVSADPLKAQEAFRDKHELAIPLVSDEQHAMLEAYGVWGEKSMYGRTFLGVLRTTVLIGADGRIVKIWRHVKVDGHADEVLAAVQAA